MANSDSATTTPARRRKQRWGENLSGALEDRELTARQFQRRLLDVGADVSIQAVNRWRSGVDAPTPENQAAIARALDVAVHELFPVTGDE